MTEVSQAPPGVRHQGPGNRRSELERLLDRTVLGPTHPELGTCWQFTGTCTPYGRIAKAQDSYTHRLGWKLLRGPIPAGKELHHRCAVYACWNPDHVCRDQVLWRSIRQRGVECCSSWPGSGWGQTWSVGMIHSSPMAVWRGRVTM